MPESSPWMNYVIVPLDEALVMMATQVPYIVAAVFVLVTGWVAALIVRWLASRVLRTLRFDAFAQRIGLRGLLDALRVESDTSDVAARVLYAILVVAVLTVTLGILAIPGTQPLTAEVLAVAPHLFAAFVVLILGLYGAMRARKTVVRRVQKRLPRDAALLGGAVYWAVISAVSVAVLDLIGLNTTLLQVFFSAGIMAVAGAGAIAFGLGGQHLARETLERWATNARQRSEDDEP